MDGASIWGEFNHVIRLPRTRPTGLLCLVPALERRVLVAQPELAKAARRR
jgi:hypothetical protein